MVQKSSDINKAADTRRPMQASRVVHECRERESTVTHATSQQHGALTCTLSTCTLARTVLHGSAPEREGGGAHCFAGMRLSISSAITSSDVALRISRLRAWQGLYIDRAALHEKDGPRVFSIGVYAWIMIDGACWDLGDDRLLFNRVRQGSERSAGIRAIATCNDAIKILVAQTPAGPSG